MVLKREDVTSYDENKSRWVWNDNMVKYKSLYELKFDEVDNVLIPLTFEIEISYKVEKIVEPVKMEYLVYKSSYKSEGKWYVTESNVKYSPIERAIIPSIVLPQRPCMLSSKETYEIVRYYINDNIDPKIAKITLDYDFCFEVKKRIKLATPKKYTVDVNGSMFDKRRKPKYVERINKEKLVTCFEMTHDRRNYREYTVIEGFAAKTQKKLKEKIDTYCKKLIDFINTPLEQCKHCNGLGIIWEERNEANFDTKKIKND